MICCKQYLLLLFLLTVSLDIQAQKKNCSIYGRVMDASTGEVLPGANVIVTDTDGKQIGGTTTLKDGSYAISSLPSGKQIIKVSFVGFNTFTKNIEIGKKAKRMNAGTIMLSPDNVLLENTTITAQLPQVEVKEDTIIFNAAAFKVPEGSVLEELIRKLPGAEVSDDGTIKINGKTVSKILVEGKEFFSNDKSMAMKNLPTEIIDKVKTYDKQSDLSRITGIDDGEEETVIDLSIKKGMKQGWFGNLDAAYGTHDRFSEKIMANRFTDNTQASLIGSYNNINDRSFPGGGGRSRQGGGDVKSGMTGLNFALDRNKIEIGGNVRYSNTNSYTETKTSSQNFVSTAASYSNSISKGRNKNGNLNSNFKLEWKIDSMTTLLFRPNFSFSTGDSESQGQSATFNSSPYSDDVDDPINQMDLIDHDVKINYNDNASVSDQRSLNADGSLMLNRRLNDRGRNLSVRINGGYSKNNNNSYTKSNITYYQYDDSTALTYRFRKTPNTSKNISAGFTYSEPLLRNVFLQLNYSYDYSKRHSDGKTYNLGNIENMLDSLNAFGNNFLPYDYRNYLDDALSRYTDNENFIHNIDLTTRVIRDNYNLSIGVRMQPQRQKVVYDYQNIDTVASRNFFRISPTLNFRYRFSKQEDLRIRYRGNTQQPNITDLFNITDNSDPLNIRLGNPNLKPSFTNNASAEYKKYIVDYQRSFFARVNCSSTSNSISNRTEYNEETGGVITKPENINGNWRFNGNFGFNSPVIWDNFYINTNSDFGYNNNVSYIYQNEQTLKNKVKNKTLGERLSFTWRDDYFDIVLNGSINYTNSRSSVVETSNRDTYDFSYGISTNINLPINLSLSTNINMNSRRGYSSSLMNTNELIWNAQIAYRFLKNKQATISLQAYDILSNKSNISRIIDATQRRDTETNAITSYAMVHFIYRLNLFGSRDVRRNMRREMRGVRDMDFGRDRDMFGGGRGGRDDFGGGGPR